MRVLVVGPSEGEIGRAADYAAARGIKVERAESNARALELLRQAVFFDAVLCDIACGVPDLIRRMFAERLITPVVACGIGNNVEAAVAAIAAGAREYLPLPPDIDAIAEILRSLTSEKHALIAQDPRMLATVRRAAQIAGSEASVLIFGQSGTGKEVLARFIHRRSRRAKGAFVAVNCAAIPENLLESELFGHEKGAFSGAIARRMGRFEAAHGGTLLLDEISEMDLRLQAKLLRAIQEREIDPLGASRPVKVDVRVIATTNRDLKQEIAAGRFREDLFYRLNVVSLEVPPLRTRPLDVRALASHFAHHFAALNGLPFRPLSQAALRRLESHAWPGNVRELENIIHRAVILAEGEEIGEEVIEVGAGEEAAPSASMPRPAVHEMTAEPMMAAPDNPISALVGRTVEDVERDLILETLNKTFGNRTHAASMLGISIRALRNKLREYAAQGVPVPPPPAGVAMQAAETF
jgi:two-component system response regulator FlrC